MTNDVCQLTTGKKCPTVAQNVRQSAEGLPDILSGMPEIIFAITGFTATSLTGNQTSYNHPSGTGLLDLKTELSFPETEVIDSQDAAASTGLVDT